MLWTKSVEKNKIFLLCSINVLRFQDDEFKSGRKPIPHISISIDCTVLRKKRNVWKKNVPPLNHENISMRWALILQVNVHNQSLY